MPKGCNGVQTGYRGVQEGKMDSECDFECRLCDYCDKSLGMSSVQFEKILNRRLDMIRDVLGLKAKEYASSQDRLWNFRRAAALLGDTPESALLGMLTKHIVSIYDMVDAVSRNQYPLPVWQEKIGDAINYLILLEALIVERVTHEASNMQ